MNTKASTFTEKTSMSNSEGGDQSVNISREIYVACQVINAILLAITLWILLCLVLYGFKTKKWVNKCKRSDVNGGMVYTASVIAVAATIPRYITDQVIFSVIYIHGAVYWCEVIMDIGNATYFVALYPIYLFLWFRQKALYGHPAMKRLAGKCVAAFSWITLVGLSLAAIGVGLMFVVPDDYTYGPEGCVVDLTHVNVSYSNDLAYQSSYYALVVLLLIAQLALLSLFIYPMCRSNAIQNSRRSSQQSTKAYAVENLDDKNISPPRKLTRFRTYMSTIREARRTLSTTSIGKKSNTVQKTIRRSVVCATISMVSDVISMTMVSMVLPRTVPRSLTNTVYDASTLVSVLCILATFSNYRDILTVFCRKSPTSGSEKMSQSSGDDSKGYSERSNQNSSV